MYLNGNGVRQDHAEALKWFRKAADQGLAVAQNNLGLMYAQGQGVPRDYVQAHMWFNLICAGVIKEAMASRALTERLKFPCEAATISGVFSSVRGNGRLFHHQTLDIRADLSRSQTLSYIAHHY